MKKNLVGRAFTWTVSITTLFVLALVAGIISLIVGDWIMLRTGNSPLAVALGIFVLVGFLSSLGTTIGIWLWLRLPDSLYDDSEDSMTRVLAEMSAAERD